MNKDNRQLGYIVAKSQVLGWRPNITCTGAPDRTWLEHVNEWIHVVPCRSDLVKRVFT